MQEFVQDLIRGIGDIFSSMYNSAPAIWGSRYPVFFLELLLIIVVFDLIIFGWRPLVRRFAPGAYNKVDYYFGQSVNVLAFVVLVVFDFYLGAQLGAAWGNWLGLSGLVWATAAIVALLFLGRLLTRKRVPSRVK